MSLRSYAEVWEGSQAKGSTLLVLLAIAEHYNPEKGYAWPSVETIASYARIASLRTVQTHLNKLEDLGELKVVRGGGRSNPSRYYLNFKKFAINKRPRRSSQINPADFAGFPENDTSETPQSDAQTPQSRVTETAQTPQSHVINPAIPCHEIAGEGIGNRRTREERGNAGTKPDPSPAPSASGGSLSLPDSGLDPSDADMVRFNLAKVYRKAPGYLSPVEVQAFETHLPILTELDTEDWKALRIWTNEADHENERVRGCKLWPRNRSQFLKHAGEAIEKVRTWWDETGYSWWEVEAARRESRAARQKESQAPEAPPADALSREEALAFVQSWQP